MAGVLEDVRVRLLDESIPWQNLVLGIGLGVGAFENWIGSRQRPYLSPVLHPHIPASLAPYLPSTTSHETFLSSQSYARDKLSFGSFVSFVDHVQTAIFLTGIAAPCWRYIGLGNTTGARGWIGNEGRAGGWTLLKGFWDLSGKVAPKWTQTQLQQSLAFSLLMMVLGQLLSLPFEYYKTFVLEEKHGFNKTTKKTFFEDQVKGFLVSALLQVPILAGVLKIIEWVGPSGMFRVVAWILAFIFAFQLIMIPGYPYVIAPLFNKFTPLAEGSPVFPLVKGLSGKLGFPLGRVWVMDGSKRSAHSNAFFFGLPYMTKHIVIYDTLLEQATPEEVEAILAHELGHWKGRHVLILLSTSLVQLAFTLSTFTLFLQHGPLLSAFGFGTTSKLSASDGPALISLLLAANLFTPMSAIMHFLTNSITRKLEYDADLFAAKQGKNYASNLKKGLVTIHAENKAIYGVDPVYSAYHHNHPTLIERLEALDKHTTIEEKKDTSKTKKEL